MLVHQSKVESFQVPARLCLQTLSRRLPTGPSSTNPSSFRHGITTRCNNSNNKGTNSKCARKTNRQHRRQRRFIRSRDEQKVALSSNKKIFSRQLQLPRIRRLRMIRPKVIRISGTSPLTKFSGLQIGRSKRQSRFCRR